MRPRAHAYLGKESVQQLSAGRITASSASHLDTMEAYDLAAVAGSRVSRTIPALFALVIEFREML